MAAEIDFDRGDDVVGRRYGVEVYVVEVWVIDRERFGGGGDYEAFTVVGTEEVEEARVVDCG